MLDERQYALKNDLNRLLTNGKVKVHFVKKDGTLRIMNCTKSPILIPLNQQPTYPLKRKVPEHIVMAFDVDLGEWRSFELDSVIVYGTENE